MLFIIEKIIYNILEFFFLRNPCDAKNFKSIQHIVILKEKYTL